MTNIIAYGAIFKAVGCELNFNPAGPELEVVKFPRNRKEIVENALKDIEKYEFTANFIDGLAAPFLANFIDNEKNCVSELISTRVLTDLGIMSDNRFVAQVLAQQKTNRSWHTSEKPNTCTYFGELCTHRGQVNIPGKRGRKSTRSPEQYHMLNKTGLINREQLTTPALEKLVAAIPEENLVHDSSGTIDLFNKTQLLKLHPDKLQNILDQIEEVKKERAKV